MAGRRPRSGPGSTRSGPASRPRRAWSAATPPGQPGQPGLPGQPGPDILERSPGRWSPSRLARPPQWLLAVIAAAVLAGGVIAVVTGGARHGRAEPRRPGAQAAPAVACSYIIGPISRAALANGMRESPQAAGCPVPLRRDAFPGRPPGAGLMQP